MEEEMRTSPESTRARLQTVCNEMHAHAALAGDLTEIGRYLAAGAEVDAGEGAALRYAVRGGDVNAVRRLFDGNHTWRRPERPCYGGRGSLNTWYVNNHLQVMRGNKNNNLAT